LYPKLSDIINDLFGTNINLPIQSYGFFLALAFLVAAWILYRELDRKEKEGLINPVSKTVWKDKPLSINELILGFVLTFIIGFKVVEAFLDYSFFADKPQEFLLSGKGNIWGAVVFALGYAFFVYYNLKLKKSTEPYEVELVVHARDHTWPIVFVAVVFGIIGAKLFHWFENWDSFIADPLGSLMSFAGLTFYGGLIVAAIAVVVYCSKNGIYWRHIADIVAPALMIAYGIGRIGCQTAGDGDWGIVNNMPKPQWLSFLPDWLWAFDYPHNIINEGVPIPGCMGPHCMQLAMPVFPTPVYETAMALVIFLILWFLRKRLEIPGVLFSIYLMFNGLERFLIEKIRVNNLFGLMGLKVTQAEVISTLIFTTGLVFLLVFTLKHKKTAS
jgi:prolipoprotein diacylglyceryltransferase